jgi:hypothetical protein
MTSGGSSKRPSAAEVLRSGFPSTAAIKVMIIGVTSECKSQPAGPAPWTKCG